VGGGVQGGAVRSSGGVLIGAGRAGEPAAVGRTVQSSSADAAARQCVGVKGLRAPVSWMTQTRKRVRVPAARSSADAAAHRIGTVKPQASGGPFRPRCGAPPRPSRHLASVSSVSSNVEWCSVMPRPSYSSLSFRLGGDVITTRLPGALSPARA
jgi:hypothetical protein